MPLNILLRIHMLQIHLIAKIVFLCCQYIPAVNCCTGNIVPLVLDLHSYIIVLFQGIANFRFADSDVAPR